MSLLIYQALQDINLVQGNIDIKTTGKTGKRELQLRPSQILLFFEYIRAIRPKLLQQNQSDAFLIGLRGERMPAEDITKHVKRSCKGMYPGKVVNAQTIRQSVITNLLKAGHDLGLVQVFAGHKYPSSTERYKQSEVETLKIAVKQISSVCISKSRINIFEHVKNSQWQNYH